MARYLDRSSAEAAGFRLVHEPERERVALYAPQPETADGNASADVANSEDPVGVAEYRLIGEQTIDFNHTFVDPRLRGTGLAGILADAAFSPEVVAGRRIATSCPFMAGYLARHPEIETR